MKPKRNVLAGVIFLVTLGAMIVTDKTVTSCIIGVEPGAKDTNGPTPTMASPSTIRATSGSEETESARPQAARPLADKAAVRRPLPKVRAVL